MSKKKVFVLVLLASALLFVAANANIASVKAQGTASIDVLASEGGTTTPATGSQTETIGQNVTFTATPSTGWQFLCWVYATAAGADSSTSNPLSYNVTGAGEMQAIFVPTTNATEAPSAAGTSSIYVLTSAGGLTTPVTGTASYTIGNVTTFTATAGTGFKFLCWIIAPASGGVVYTSNPLQYNVTNGGCAAQAVFLPTSSTVTLPSTISEFSAAATVGLTIALIAVAIGTFAYKRTKK